jgi:hypothetical protein
VGLIAFTLHVLTGACSLCSGGLKNVIFGALGGFALDWMWTGRSLKGLKRKHEEELELVIQKFQADREMIEIKKRMQLEEYQLRLLEAEQTIQQLQQAAVDAGMDLSYTQSQLDYEEFKQPDLNNDDMITREEFNAYIRMYMQTYPHIKREDMPRFEDFDLNGDGIVSFKEWEIYLDHQRRAEDETAYNNDVMNALYEQTHKSQGFNDVYNNMQRGGGARGRY